MSITNRTPHPITILAADGIAVVASYPAGLRGEIARVETTTEDDGRLDGVPVMRTRWGQIVGLPAPATGAYHIVSTIVAEAAIDCGRGADDLLVPGDQVRDQQGRIVGCRGLTRAASSSPALAGQRGYRAALAAHRRTDPEALNLRPEPESPAVELEYLVHSFDQWVKDARHLRLEGGWSHDATEAHGALRVALLGLVRRTVTQCLAEPLDGMSPAQVRQHVVARLVDVLGDRMGDLPSGHSGREYVSGWPGRSVTFPTLTH